MTIPKNWYDVIFNRGNSLTYQVILLGWTLALLGLLMYFSIAETLSQKFFSYFASLGISQLAIAYVGIPLVMAARAVIFVEASGYLYHRFFQHLGFLTRCAQGIRRNQRFHWIHHMIFYPIGKNYKQRRSYKSSEKGIPWNWAIPLIIAIVIIIYVMGFNVKTPLFLGAAFSYIWIVKTTHSRFHMVDHPWSKSKYFKLLEDIHVLHHWDQGTNYTIVNPFLDMVLGTYHSPYKYRKDINEALKPDYLTLSDLKNWKYLLTEATPGEYAAFISAAKQYPRVLGKMPKMLSFLRKSRKEESRSMYGKALACLQEINTKRSKQILAGC